MVSVRLMVLAAAGVAIAGCANNNTHNNSLPTPLYALQKVPPAYRKTPEGVIVDDADVHLDAQGYRVDKNGKRIQQVDVQQKMANENSNPVAGYYISSIGAAASGNVMAPSVGAGSGVGAGPGSATIVPGGQALPPVPRELLPTPGEGPMPPQ
ncbi:hypothetical protein SAMN02745126_00505 [Enhydrobacter aerosaccus]|uniref:Uncharacterized protein n=1 Tax=Enhydrobacter aerosaccus TaxID=225324 RepID=A0A1T4JVQ6_9HYPH|nr:hypothetical protein [Enhydrobacter aerosaccus]SJZ34147.1 hypothetical protein SAMN02745126_00505 [Enhydrobacter aerosaccus]